MRFCFSGMLACLLAASLALPVGRASADEETITPTEELVTQELVEETPTIPAEATSTTSELTSTPTATVTGTVTSAPILGGRYVADEVLVRFKNVASDDDIAQCLGQINGQVISTIEEIRVTVIEIESINVSNAVASLSACPAVRYVEPNYLVYAADTIPTDSAWGLQYGLVNIRAPQGWDTNTGSSAITIAVLDTGVDLAHADLAAKIVPGYDFVNNDSVPQDDHGHGTHVAGIAAAVTNNANGIAGTSWGARIMPVKVLNAAGGGTFANVAAGITWAADNGAQIINLSVGGASSSIVLQNAIDYAAGQGVLIVAASGNAGINQVLYPAVYPNVIAVGAIDSLNNISASSNYGAELDLVAPGVNIYSTSPGGYGYRNGTSMATAFVSGLASILRGMGHSASSARSIMETTALDLGTAGWDMFHGNGLIQMDAAILAALPGPQGNNNQPTWAPLLPGGFLPTITLTASPTPTLNVTLSLSSETPTLTQLAPENGTGSDVTPTPEIIALETELSPQPGAGGNWYIPVCALLLILLGVLLFWVGSRRKWRSYSGLYF